MPDFTTIAAGQWLSSASTTFALVSLAEFGDKSQLVCMTLAARHRSLPVALGAISAFAILNLLAVLFGASVAAWLPESLVTLAVAALFATFGINCLRHQAADEEAGQTVVEKTGRSVFANTFLMIFLAELGDKTQIAVAGLGSTSLGTSVWLGATLALASTSILGIYAGQKLLQRFPLRWIQRISGIFFLLLALLAIGRFFLLP